ncbi:GNAT family N-acetyltransferase [Modicisalibacter radicis]|uniref:GNAT family N-acetyltransferase n=1 Tax=Halomonas sp. EAR18 TaxID=2518972 RepID=UPI00109D7231|nr:GNAT family protein [Halomonas sp. EAR18]
MSQLEDSPPVGDPVPGWRGAAWPERRILQGRLCRLEPLDEPSHGEALWGAMSLPGSERNWTYLPYGPFPDQTAYRHWLAEMAGRRDPLFFAIVDEASGLAAGVASFLRIAPDAGSIEVGHIHFSPRLQRTPAASEAMLLLMREAFALGYRRYEWKCDALNAPSRRAAERLGFSFEGVFRQATVVKGRNRDTAWFSVIDGEWPALEAAFERWLAPDNFDADGRQREALATLTRGAGSPA